MISPEQFIARCDDAQLLHETQEHEDAQLEKELAALCALTGYQAQFWRLDTAYVGTGLRWVTINDEKGHLVTQGVVEDILHGLVAERDWENDAPFSIFTPTPSARERTEPAGPPFVNPADFLRGLAVVAGLYEVLADHAD
jgi:hypothetical protein